MRDRPTNPRINPLDNEARAQHWSQKTTLAEKLYGSKEDLLKATGMQKTRNIQGNKYPNNTLEKQNKKQPKT